MLFQLHAILLTTSTSTSKPSSRISNQITSRLDTQQKKATDVTPLLMNLMVSLAYTVIHHHHVFRESRLKFSKGGNNNIKKHSLMIIFSQYVCCSHVRKCLKTSIVFKSFLKRLTIKYSCIRTPLKFVTTGV